MNVLVAGGAGFVGTNLSEALLDDGHRVFVIDNLSTGRYENVRRNQRFDSYHFRRHDVAERPTNMWPDTTMDVVIHLASPASPDDYAVMPLQTMMANSLGTWRLLERAQRNGALFVFASTSEVYGDPLETPQRESYRGNVDPIGPRSCYDESKRFGEALVAAFRPLGVRAAIVRIFNTYGPLMARGDGRVIPEMLEAVVRGTHLPIQGDGSQTRSFMFVDDLVAALKLVIEDPNADGLVANVGSPDEVTIADLARLVEEVGDHSAGVRSTKPRPDDPRRRCPDITVMRERYGWEPKWSLKDGLVETLAWMRGRDAAE